MNQQEKEVLIERWLQDELSDQEILKSISQEELSQYKSILNTVDNWIPQGSSELPNEVSKIVAHQKEAKIVSINRTPWIISIAASIALLLTVSLIFFRTKETVYYAENQNLEIVLPDESTKVILSPGATLSYKKFDPESRIVKIDGRAYFDVTEKGPFEVVYEGGSIAVLGTQFEIIHFQDYFEASCFEGSVQVHYKNKRVRMEENEKVVYENNDLPKVQVSQGKPSWTSGQEKFSNDPLLKVISVLESQYQIQVESNNVSLERRYTGILPIKNLEVACVTIFSPLGINFTIKGDQVFLSE